MPVNADLDWAIEDVRARARALHLYKDYDEGRHRLLFATEKYRNTFGDLFREFADNMCDDVVDGITDRLQIVGWGAGTDQSLNAAVDAAWDRVKGEARTGAIHRHAFRDGDGFAIVQEAADGQGRVYKQDPRLMAIRYSVEDPDEKALVAKVWKAGTRYRVNLYYPDRTEKWASRGLGSGGDMPKAASFQMLKPGDPALKDDEEGTTVVDGIPVYHFPNGELSQYGRSLLENVIPLQDALNKTVADMLVNNEFTAYPQRWASGIQVERDEVTGQEKDPFVKAGPGTIVRTGKAEARFGQFDASNPEGFLATIDSFRLEIARKGYLPPHTIQMRSGSSTPPSGIALLVAEGRTIKVAKDRQRDWGGEHQAMMANVVSIDLNTTVDPADLDPNWAPPETRDMKALLEELALKVDLGLPERQALIEAGYDADDVDEWLGEAQTQGDAEAVALSVLQGGRAGVTRNAAGTLNGSLGMPGGPVPPGGGQSALTGE